MLVEEHVHWGAPAVKRVTVRIPQIPTQAAEGLIPFHQVQNVWLHRAFRELVGVSLFAGRRDLSLHWALC